MQNTSVFNDYDMVLTMSEALINDQLSLLRDQEIIHQKFIMYSTWEGENVTYHVVDSPDLIPRDANGNPTEANINAEIFPQVMIEQSGTVITFLLKFPSGTANFWVGRRNPVLKQFEIKDWQYAVAIGMDLKALEKEDIGKKIKVPKNIENQLHHFMDNMFTVNHLFMDFESSDLLRFDANQTKTPGGGDVGEEVFVEFVNGFLTKQVANGNPYILGYSIETRKDSNYGPGEIVPPSIRPMGTTYSMYHDPVNQKRSNLNFVLATVGGHNKIVGSPGNFNSNWLTDIDPPDLQAKVIYSNDVLIEKLILRPFYEKLKNAVYKKIKDTLDEVDKGNEYNDAKTPIPGGFSFALATDHSGDQQYTSDYNVLISSGQGKVSLDISGRLHFYKKVVKKNMANCMGGDAWGASNANIDWTANLTITTTKNADGKPILKLSYSKNVPKADPHNTKNDCAKFWDGLAKVLGNIVGGFSLGQGALSDALDNLPSLDITGFGNLSEAFNDFGSGLNNSILLPAGGVFAMDNPTVDSEYNFYIDLKYKSVI